MAKGAFFLFGMNNVSTTETVNSYTNTFHMPYITPSMVSTSGLSKDGFELFLRPSYTKALVDLVRHYGWSKAYYVYDSDEGRCNEHVFIQATLLNPDMCNPDFRLKRTDWKVPVPSHTYNSYMHNPDFA